MRADYDYVIVKVPEGTAFDALPADTQRLIIEQLDARWPPSIAPGTVPVGGYQLVNAIIPRDKFLVMAQANGIDPATLQSDPQAMKQTLEGLAAAYGLSWTLMYMRTVDGYDTGQVDADGNPIYAPVEFYPMDPTVKDFLAPDQDANGNPVPRALPAKFAAYDVPGLRRWPVIVN